MVYTFPDPIQWKEKMADKSRHHKLRFLEKKEFLKYHLPDVGLGGLQWVTNKQFDLGEILSFSVKFAGYPQEYTIEAKVVWRNSRPPMCPELPEGVGLEVISSSDAAFSELLHFASTEEADALHAVDDRQASRIRVDLEVEYLYKTNNVFERVLDISAGGIFVRTDKILEEGERFVFFLHDDNFVRPWVMEGKSVWTNVSDDKMGFAVKFLFDSRKHKREVRQYVSALAEEIEEL